MPLIDIFIPEAIGPVEECVVVTWLKREGNHVNEDDDLLVLQADKTSYDVPSPVTGILTTILAQQGDVVKKDEPLARMEVSEADAASTSSTPEPQSDPAPPPSASPPRDVRASPVAKRLAREHGIDLAQVSGSGKEGRITEKDILAVIEAKTPTAEAEPPIKAPPPARDVRASPVARRIAREHGIDLLDIPGAGERRITEKDVRAYIDAQQPQSDRASSSVEAESIPMAGMRAAIAQRMHQSLQEMAQLTLHTEVDVTELVGLRASLKAEMAATYTDLFVRATALALRQHPRVNATLSDNVINLQPDINIGLAVALDDGLIVPVLRQVDQQSLANLVRDRQRLVERARANKLMPDEYSGGTFTITNLGAYDIDAFTPIVNPPEAAILGVGRIVEKVVIHDNKIAQRAMMTLSLSFDHRLIDGAPAAAFLQTIKKYLEQPEKATYLN
ncbi:MAG: 2-oxo acid dehydrogenase subunit E2 [Chloroflexota bacterium]